MIDIADVKADIIDYIQANVAGFTIPISVDEVREVYWRGTQFNYPAIRVGNVREQMNTASATCHYYPITFSVYVFTKDESSRNCDIMGYELAQLFEKKNYTGTHIKFILLDMTSLSGATPIEDVAWVTELSVRANVQKV